ncbi:hypothetical protein [Streptomyces sp. H51]|nr:hypothetical protein [Streptomyces sp. H51]
MSPSGTAGAAGTQSAPTTLATAISRIAPREPLVPVQNWLELSASPTVWS